MKETTATREISFNILVTGSSGYLGSHLVRHLRNAYQDNENRKVTLISVDLVPSPTTTHIGSIADSAFVADLFHIFNGFDAVFHTATLHQPHLKTHTRRQFMDTNVTGTLNLLEEASAYGARAFIFTSTTSLMISKAMKDSTREKEMFSEVQQDNPAFWVTEEETNLVPRNIYGVTKLSAEHLIRLTHERTKMPSVILRTSRFFSEEDTDPPSSSYELRDVSEVNKKLNEFLYRRVSVVDVVRAHDFTLQRLLFASPQYKTLYSPSISCPSKLSLLPPLTLDTFIVSAPSPFSKVDCVALGQEDGPSMLLDRYYPAWREAYRKLGFQLSIRIDRVYCSQKAIHTLGFQFQHTFETVLKDLVNKVESGISIDNITIHP